MTKSLLNIKTDKIEFHILDSAINVFSKKGFNESTLADIAAQADVSKNTIYHHFANKKQILVCLLERIWQHLADDMIELSENNELDPLEKIDKLIDNIIDIFCDNPRLALVFFNEHNPILRGNNDSLNAHYIHYLKAFSIIFNQGIKNQFINTNVDGRVFLFFVHGGLRNLLNEWAIHADVFPIEKVRSSIKYQVKHGILRW